ncbi:MAG: DUF4097 domain-containing protein [Pyrinomonadaceae bacterium]
MKRLIILIALVLAAGIAGIVRSHSRVHLSELPSFSGSETRNVRDEVRKSFELAPGAHVEVSGINGAVKIETGNMKTAEVYIERTGESAGALGRRKITVDADPNQLTIHGRKTEDLGFLASLFGSNPSERVTLKVPRQISLLTKGINGSVTVGELDGAIEVHAVNGRVEIAGAVGSADLKGINGNIQVNLKQVTNDGVSISGINGNIELQLSDLISADLEAHGMNGRVVSDLPNVTIDKNRHGSYSARIGTGGAMISAHGINGNIRLSRATLARTDAAATTSTAND